MVRSGIKTFSLLAILLILPGSVAIADAAPDDDGYADDVPSAITTHQRIQFGYTADSQLDIYLASGDSFEAVLESVRSVVGSRAVKDAPFLGFVRDGMDRAEIHLADRQLRPENQQIFSEDESVSSASESLESADHSRIRDRRIASEDPTYLSRADLLRRFEKFRVKHGEPEIKRLATMGDRALTDAYNKSARRWSMVFVRSVVAGGAMAIGVSTLPAGISIPLVAATAGASGFFMAKADWMAHFVGYRTALEQKFIDLARRFSPRAKKEKIASGFIASHLKWGGIEMTANTAIKLTGYSAYSLSEVADIPKNYQLISGMHDALVLTGETVITQGVYEIVINREFAKRNLVYHALLGYALEALETETNPVVIGELKSIIASCRRAGLRERVTRAVFLTLGTASWALASALRVLPDAIYARIASYSLLGAAGLLKSYYYVREIHEERILRRPNSDYLSEVGRRLSDGFRKICTSVLGRSKGAKS